MRLTTNSIVHPHISCIPNLNFVLLRGAVTDEAYPGPDCAQGGMISSSGLSALQACTMKSSFPLSPPKGGHASSNRFSNVLRGSNPVQPRLTQLLTALHNVRQPIPGGLSSGIATSRSLTTSSEALLITRSATVDI